MGALKDNFEQDEVTKDKPTGFVGSVFTAIIVATIFSVFSVNYPTAMTWICGLLAFGGIVQIFKRDQSKQKRFQSLMITFATGFALVIANAASKAKSLPNSQLPTTQPQIVTVPSTNGDQYEPLKAEDIDQAKVVTVALDSL